ncbi:unnamed protein product [Penicillium pancosmium]
MSSFHSAHNPEDPSPRPRGDGLGEQPAKKRRVDGEPHLSKLLDEDKKSNCLWKLSIASQLVNCAERAKLNAIKNGLTVLYASSTVLHASIQIRQGTATQSILDKLDQLQDDIDSLKRAAHQEGYPGTQSLPRNRNAPPTSGSPLEASRGSLQIPPHLMSADTVLKWPIFQEKYPSDALIGELFKSQEVLDPFMTPLSAEGMPDPSPLDKLVSQEGLRPLDDEKIPQLIDNFLQFIHTKNPILDMETLLNFGRKCARDGVGWGSLSCLVLLACALGSVAHSFDTSIKQQADLAGAVLSGEVSRPNSMHTYNERLQQGESYFLLACRRLGLVRPSKLGVQCYFLAGVYLMYTLRPIMAWQYFSQASTLLLVHLKTIHGLGKISTEYLGLSSVCTSEDRRQLERIEQSLYWSCFKSECEFRVELPFPQSELSLGEYLTLFPSPPSPDPYDCGPKKHARYKCKEEESWYYYLTEIALRRIGNRIINSFFCEDRSFWLNIRPFLRIAQEFEVQVSSWSAHLPPAMQHLETTSVIRAPHLDSQDAIKGSPVSRELSWAVDNRLLEMQTWLYQPFIYYLIHVGVSPVPSSVERHPYHRSSTTDHYVHNAHLSTESPSSDSNRFDSNMRHGAGESSSMDNEDLGLLRSMITSGIECNLKTIDVRSVGHRHHGLWFDLRSIMCASLTLLAVVKSGNAAWIPGEAETLWGPKLPDLGASSFPVPIMGRISKVIDQFKFWSAEAPHLLRYSVVLEEVVRDVRGF